MSHLRYDSAWVNELARQLNSAVENPGESTIFVPNKIRKRLAERALKKMAPNRTDIKIEVES